MPGRPVAVMKGQKRGGVSSSTTGARRTPCLPGGHQFTRRSSTSLPELDADTSRHANEQDGATGDGEPRRRRNSVVQRERMQQKLAGSPIRRLLLRIISSPRYELFLGLIVSYNIFLLKEDTDSAAACPTKLSSCTPQWVVVSDLFLLAIYTIDLACSIFALRWTYFTSAMNWLDLGIVFMGYVEVLIDALVSGAGGEMSILRMLRICRMVRVAKLFKPFPQLYKLVTGFVYTIRALFWGFVMLILLLAVWSIVILQIFTALDTKDVFQDPRFGGSWCDDAHESVAKLGLLLWQSLIAGDSWGACTIPVVLKHPAMYWIYAGAFVCINIGFTNLILAVIVENASEQHDAELLRREEEITHEHEQYIEGFSETFKELDTNNAGTVDYDELVSGYHEIPEFHEGLLKFGICEGDLLQMFHCIDLDGNGEITYMEFVDAMLRSQRQNMSTQLVMLQMAVKKLLVGMNTLLTNNTEPASPKEDRRWPSNTSPTLRPAYTPREKTNFQKMEAEAPGTSQSTATEQSLECIRHMQMKSLELQLQSAAETVHQHSLMLARGTQELRATLASVQESDSPPSKESSSEARDFYLVKLSSNGSSGCNDCPSVVPETQDRPHTKETAIVPKSLANDCDVLPEVQEDSWAVGEEHRSNRTNQFGKVAFGPVVCCWPD